MVFFFVFLVNYRFIPALTILLLVSPAAAQPHNAPGVAWFRIYESERGSAVKFRDVFAQDDDCFALCGELSAGVNHLDGWVMIVRDNGDVLYDVNLEANEQTPKFTWLNSIIQTDDGGYLVGGRTQVGALSYCNFDVIKLNEECEIEWWRVFVSDDHTPECFAVIELKGGAYLACGRGENMRSYAVMFNNQGEVIWERYYFGIWLTGVREVEDGFIFCNHNMNGGRITEFIRTNFDGEPLWISASGGGQPWTILTGRDGGYLAGGGALFFAGFWAVKCSNGGDIQWTLTNHVGMELERYQSVYGAARLSDGYMLVGEAPEGRVSGAVLRTDEQGNPEWNLHGYFLPDSTCAISLRSVVALDDDRSVVCGGGSRFDRVDNRRVSGGLLMIILPDRLAPLIIARSPEDAELTVLRGDSLLFTVTAVDQQDDRISYLWTAAGEEVSRDSFAVVRFDELGDVSVQCRVSDGQHADSTAWLVHVKEFFIRNNTPDSLDLTIRRGREVEFALDVAAVEPEAVNYLWTISSSERLGDSLFSQSSIASWRFIQSGEYRVVAEAFIGDLSESRIWRVNVRSLIFDWIPAPLSLQIPKDTVIAFEIFPFNPEDESLTYLWTFNGEPAGEESHLDADFNQPGNTVITAFVCDSADADTLTWRILVNDFQSSNRLSSFPASLDLSVNPNPFNALTTISFSLERPSNALLTIYDLCGREAAVVASGYYSAGRHTVVFDGRALAAGGYLLRLDAGIRAAALRITLLN